MNRNRPMTFLTWLLCRKDVTEEDFYELPLEKQWELKQEHSLFIDEWEQNKKAVQSANRYGIKIYLQVDYIND